VIVWYRVGPACTFISVHTERADTEIDKTFADAYFNETLRKACDAGYPVFCLDEIERQCRSSFQRSGECLCTFLDAMRTQGITVVVRDLASDQLRELTVGEGQLMYESARVCFAHSNWRIDPETLLKGEQSYASESKFGDP